MKNEIEALIKKYEEEFTKMGNNLDFLRAHQFNIEWQAGMPLYEKLGRIIYDLKQVLK